MNHIRKCITTKCIERHIILDHIHKYVDPRAYISRGDVRYSIKLDGKWHRRVLKNTEISRIVGEMYGDY